MKFVRYRLATLVVASALVSSLGCTENGAGLTKGEVPPDMPKTSEDAFKKMGNMAPDGAPKTARPKMAPPRPTGQPATK